MADRDDDTTTAGETEDRATYRRKFDITRISQDELIAEIKRRNELDRWAIKQELQQYIEKKWPGLKLGEILTAREPGSPPLKRSRRQARGRTLQEYQQ